MRPLQYHIPTEVKPPFSNTACSAGTYGLTSATLLAQLVHMASPQQHCLLSWYIWPHLSNTACSAGTYGLKLFYFMYIYTYFLYKCVLQKYSFLQNSVLYHSWCTAVCLEVI